MLFLRKSAETKAPDESKAILAALNRVQAVITFDLEGRILQANENFLSLMGYAPDEIAGKHHRMFVPPAHAESAEYREHWKKLGRGAFVSGEFERIAKGGRLVWIEASYNPVLGADGKPVKVVTFAIDITGAKLAAADAGGQIEAISKSQAVIEFGLDGTIRTANAHFLAAMGYQPGEVEGRHHRMFVEEEVAGTAQYRAFWDALADGKHQSGEFKRIAKGGRAVWIQASYNPILDPNGTPYKVVKYATDITAAKLAAADAGGQIEAISKSQAVIEFGLDGTIRTANANFLAAMGYELSEIEGRHHRIFVDPEHARSPEYEAFWAALRSGEYQAAEYRRIGKGGREVWIQASYNPILDPDGRPYKVVKYATDVTARKRAMNEFGRSLVELAEGDLAARIPDSVTGEFAGLRDSFNATMQRFRDLVRAILDASQAIAQESEAIASNAKDLSSRGERQAATVEETSAAMEQISSTVRSTAGNAEGATTAAREASQHAETGGKVVSDAIAAMNRIEQSSAEIRKIIQVIDSIAFQTNLLALNAGVEAARAGDAGRGFAVVASEVRALAQRASDAAKEINALIETSSREVAEGSNLVNQSGKALSQIVAAVAAVVETIGDISTAAREQAAGIAEVTQAISNIDATTQHTAALSEESAAAASDLAERASQLRAYVGHFRGAGAGSGAAAPNVRRLETAASALPAPPAAAATAATARPRKAAAAAAHSAAAAPAEDEGWDEF